ncbi:MAG: TIGR00266 family protein [Lachnospiraceae bacterium]|nr:TIGR00266 family protein [Lachnospiraceae bacterium]
MRYRIEGGNLPVLLVQLEQGEAIQCEAGGMSWMDDGLIMETHTGGIGKMLGRAFTGENLFTNTYIAQRPGEIAMASSFPGDIRAYEVHPGQTLICQKNAFMAMVGNVEMSVAFQKRLGGALFGGEGLIMQQFTGEGLVFIEIDGSSYEYNLAPGERKIIDTGNMVMMDGTCSMDVQTVNGIGNALFGGEGLFNTVVTGPGRVVVQSMPISSTAMKLYRYMPHSN